jgi:hypothetical protein
MDLQVDAQAHIARLQYTYKHHLQNCLLPHKELVNAVAVSPAASEPKSTSALWCLSQQADAKRQEVTGKRVLLAPVLAMSGCS